MSNKKYLKNIPNLVHYLDTFTEDGVVNALIEINAYTINKYEIDNEAGYLKLDRVGYSSLAYPFVYGELPKTLDEDGDPLDIMVVNVTEPLIPGSVAECRVIGLMKFDDDGEVDDKVIAVLNDDKRSDDIESIEQLGEHFVKEATYFFEHYKDLKKPGTGAVGDIVNTKKAIEIILACQKRYEKEVLPNVEV